MNLIEELKGNFDVLISTIVDFISIILFFTAGLPFLAVFSFYATQRFFFWIFEYGKFTVGMLAPEKPERRLFVLGALGFVFALLLSMLNIAFFAIYYFATQVSSNFSLILIFENLPLTLYSLLLVGLFGFIASFVYYCAAKKYEEKEFVGAAYNSFVSLPLMAILTILIAFGFAFFRNDVLIVAAFITLATIIDKVVILLLRKLLGKKSGMSEREKEIREFKW